MSIYASNNLFKGIKKYSASGGALLGGIIANSISEGYSRDIIDDFSARTDTQIIQYVPRSITVTQSELKGKTTIEAAPDSDQAKVYKQLAERIAAHEESKTPSPLELDELRNWAAGWSDKLLELETGVVVGGEKAGI
jgi:nitrogenase iron protein NifH